MKCWVKGKRMFFRSTTGWGWFKSYPHLIYIEATDTGVSRGVAGRMARIHSLRVTLGER